MRNLITGIDDQGRSCIVEENEVNIVPVAGIAGVATALLWRTDQSPPPSRPPGTGHLIDVNMPPGIVRWMVIDHQPHDAPTTATEMHYSDTLDLVYMLSGSATFELGDGPHRIVAGDCIVTTGIDHAWKVDPGGCRMLAFAVGTPPPS